MDANQTFELDEILNKLSPLLSENDATAVSHLLAEITTEQVVDVLERLPEKQRAFTYRLLAKDTALEVFEALAPSLQSDLIHGLQDAEVASVFASLDPDDRVWLLDELPAALAPRLLQGLTKKERQMTSEVLGYPKGSVGRRMSPEYVSTRSNYTVGRTLERVNARLDDAETIYVIPVLNDSRRVVGTVTLRELMKADESIQISEIMKDAPIATAYQSAEAAARLCTEQGVLALTIVDKEERLVGVLTIDDAVRILEQEESEDTARQGGVEPLTRPYLATPIRTLVRSRVVWLLVLAVGATLTVQVLSHFEGTLAKVTVLALFVPLLIGTGGNTGNQAATTVTRALALNDVRPSDIWRVLGRELRVGFFLGSLLGIVGGGLAAAIYNPAIGLVIGLTLVAVCTTAATVGGVMPIIARALKVDPAVFSNPFITTFVDASGLVIYFLIAKAVLGI
ncbi:MAG: magnesium transporter [Microbacteriaceae bacterium]|nr:magnesium transporter [Microbacteriaceae bacterium]